MSIVIDSLGWIYNEKSKRISLVETLWSSNLGGYFNSFEQLSGDVL